MLVQASCFVLLLFSLLQQAPPSAAPQFRVSGIVVNALNGQPVAHAQVFLASHILPDSPRVTTAADDGRFAFENLPSGTYELSARRRAYIQQAYKQHESFSTAIIVGPDLNTDNLRFELRPGASVSGQILDEINDPVRNAQVMLIRQGLRSGRPATWKQKQVGTDDQGHYHFGNLTAGTYLVGVSAHPWYAQQALRQRVARLDPNSGQTAYEAVTNADPALDVVYPVTFFPNTSDISAAAPIILHPDDAATADITLQPIPALHLFIRSSSFDETAEAGQFLPQVTQHIADGIEEGLGVQWQQVGTGVMEVSGLPPGRFNLALPSSKGNESTTRSQIVQLVEDAEINASDALPSSSVSGVIKMDDGSRFSRPVNLQFHGRTTEATLGVQSEPSGEFALKGQNVAPGTYDVAIPGPGAYAIRSIIAAGAKVSGHTVETAPGQDVRLTVVVSAGSGQVKGVAVKGDKTIDGVMIILVPEDPEHNLELFRRDQSDSDGSFNLFGILPGKYSLIALENAWDLEWFRPAALQKYLAGGETLQINPNARLQVKVNVQQQSNP